MRFDSIHVQNFGHFSNFELSFGDSPLVLIQGHNEAGKTTLLEFLRQLLFGFPERTPYNFGTGEVGGGAHLTLADGRRVQLKRRKGRKNTVQATVDHDTTELDDLAFRRLLGNANENVFKSIFAFGLDELRSGNESLREESLQSALFGGGLGAAFNPDSILQDLTKSASEFFKPAASRPTINVLSKEIKELSTELRGKQVRSDEYEKRQLAWREAQSEADRRSAELQELRLEAARLERIDGALPLWTRWRTLKEQRAALPARPALPADAAEQFARCASEAGRLQRELTVLNAELSADERQLSELQLDKTVLPWQSAIESCQRQIQSVADARRDRPVLNAQRVRQREELIAELRSLRPGWSLDDLRDFVFDAATKRQLQLQCQRWDALQEQGTVLKTQLQHELEAATRCHAELQTLGPERDPAQLLELVERGQAYLADKKLSDKIRADAARLALSRDSLLARLAPPLTTDGVRDAREVGRLPIPPRELVGQFDREFRAARQALENAAQSLADETDARDRVADELAAMTHQWHDVPERADLEEARRQRDERLASLRARLLEDKRSAADSAVEWDAVVVAMVTADRVADAIQRHATEVARREETRRRLASYSERIHHRAALCETRRLEQNQLEQRWCGLWDQTRLTPLSPDLMLAWCATFTQFAETQGAVDEKLLEVEACRARITEFEDALRQQFPEESVEPQVLLRALRTRAESIADENAQRRRLTREARLHAQAMQECEAKQRAWQAERAAWREPWQALLEKLGFPPEWDTAFTREIVGQLTASKERLAQLNDLERRLEQIEQCLADFDPLVRHLCEQLGEDFDAQLPERNAAAFQKRLADATQSQERRNQLDGRLAGHRRRLVELTAHLNEARTRQQELFAMAGVTNEAEFQPVVRQAELAARLDADISAVADQLAVARGKESVEAFETGLQAADPPAVRARLESLAQDLALKQGEEKQARETAGSLRRRWEELDGGDAAARLQEQVARKQAQLATDVHRYVPLVFAHHLLRAAIERFERDNQPELLRHISRLFQIMTAGRYTEIERPTGDRTALYVRRADGAERSPEQLSTATREQLYLAIRLGYVLHYCRQTEPLPIVMDDVLVNFDAQRALATLEALREVSEHAQILFFTCHHHVRSLVTRIFPDAETVSLPDGAR